MTHIVMRLLWKSKISLEKLLHDEKRGPLIIQFSLYETACAARVNYGAHGFGKSVTPHYSCNLSLLRNFNIPIFSSTDFRHTPINVLLLHRRINSTKDMTQCPTAPLNINLISLLAYQFLINTDARPLHPAPPLAFLFN